MTEEGCNEAKKLVGDHEFDPRAPERFHLVEEIERGGVTYRLSTVKLMIDHGFGGTPIWFESMVFPQGSSGDLYCERYATADQARRGHCRLALQWQPEAPETSNDTMEDAK